MKANPYAEALGSRDPMEVMQQTPAKLAQLVDGLSPEQTEQQPAPGKWSVREIICHMADCEIAWAWRLRTIYEKDNPTLQPFDQDPWARIYGAYTLTQARITFDALRTWNLAFLAGLTEADKQRPATHPERGALTLWTIAEATAGHDLHHIAGLERQLRKA